MEETTFTRGVCSEALQGGSTEFYSGNWSIAYAVLLFEISLIIFSMTSLKQHEEYFNFTMIK